MTTYELLKFLHVVAAIAWIGGGLFHVFATVRLRGAEPVVLARWGEVGVAAGTRYYSVSAVAALLAGIGMVLLDSSIGFGDAWITIGFAGFVASLVLGAGLISRVSEQLVAARESGADGTVVTGLERRLDLLNAVDITVLLVVVWAMVVKPGA